jgi:hypothetical protein
MVVTCDCAEGRHEVCRGAGPNHYCPQTAHLGDQKCACGCHKQKPRSTAVDAPDTRKSSAITDHAYEPPIDPETWETIWWGLCKVCRLAEAAHSETTVKR